MHTFFQKSVFLSHLVSKEGVQKSPDKIQVVADWPTSTNANHVRSLLGLASYYQKFVKGFADIARPLHKICERKLNSCGANSVVTPFKN